MKSLIALVATILFIGSLLFVSIQDNLNHINKIENTEIQFDNEYNEIILKFDSVWDIAFIEDTINIIVRNEYDSYLDKLMIEEAEKYYITLLGYKQIPSYVEIKDLKKIYNEKDSRIFKENNIRQFDDIEYFRKYGKRMDIFNR